MSDKPESDMADLLGRLTIEKLIERLEDPECPAAYFETARKLIKDQGIDCLGAAGRKVLDLEDAVEGRDPSFQPPYPRKVE